MKYKKGTHSYTTASHRKHSSTEKIIYTYIPEYTLLNQVQHIHRVQNLQPFVAQAATTLFLPQVSLNVYRHTDNK